MNEDTIKQRLAQIIDPDKNVPVTNFISKITVNKGDVTLVLEYEGLNEKSAIANKEQLRITCIKAIEAVEGVRSVKVALTSHQANPVLINSNRSSLPSVKKIIIVASGKGGVGKSTIAANLAITLANMKYRVGLLDADIYGPSLSKLFALNRKPIMNGDKMQPLTKYGLQLMSIGFLVDPEEAIVWRGPMVSKMLHQMLRFTAWGDLDYLIIDTPPGTGDVHLTLAENYIIDGAIIVSTPQQLAIIDAQKGINMFMKLNIPMLGVIENMSYFISHDGQVNYIFGKDGGIKLAKKNGVPFLGNIPMMLDISESSDNGKPIAYFSNSNEVSNIFNQITKRALLC